MVTLCVLRENFAAQGAECADGRKVRAILLSRGDAD